MTHEMGGKVGGWTVDTLHAFLIAINAEKDRQQAERDIRYQQRFVAQQDALHAALLASEKAVGAALIASDRAASKTETALEKRFDSVNEFRKTLTDQNATFLTRAEGDARFDAINGKLMDNTVAHGFFVMREEHRTLAAEVNRLELIMRTTSADSVRREDIIPLTNEINNMRDTHATYNNSFWSFGIAVFAVLVSLGSIWYSHTASLPEPQLDRMPSQRHAAIPETPPPPLPQRAPATAR